MTLAQCPRCHNYSLDHCNCRLFLAWYKEHEANDKELAVPVYAKSSEAAAEKAAAEEAELFDLDLDEENLQDGINIWISKGEGSKITKFNVKVTVTLKFTASRAK